MKPDWKDAPEWAKWLAMDENGEWYWFEIEPEADAISQWLSPDYESRIKLAGVTYWNYTKEARPGSEADNGNS